MSSGNFRICSFFDDGSYFVKCSANIPYPIISNNWQNLRYLTEFQNHECDIQCVKIGIHNSNLITQ